MEDERCPGHENHLCQLVEKRTPVDELRELVRDPKYICKGCGRAAREKNRLCAPVEL